MPKGKAPKASRKFQSVAEVASMLGVGENKVLGWIGSGDIVATDVSQSQTCRPRWRIATEEVKRFVSARRSVPTISSAQPARTRTLAGVKEFVR